MKKRDMSILEDKEGEFRYTMMLLVFIFSALSVVVSFGTLLNGFSALRIAFVLILIAISIGLFFKRAIAQGSAQVVLLLVIVISIFGYINPFTVRDIMAVDQTPPPIWKMFLNISPILIVCGWSVYVLDKYKHKFAKLNGK